MICKRPLFLSFLSLCFDALTLTHFATPSHPFLLFVSECSLYQSFVFRTIRGIDSGAYSPPVLATPLTPVDIVPLFLNPSTRVLLYYYLVGIRMTVP